VRYGDTTQDIFIANSDGLQVSDTRTRIRMYVECVAAQKETVQTGMEAPGAHAGLEFFNLNRADEIAATAARRAILNLSARPAPAGTFMVVLAGEAGGTLVHEACGHALEADFIYKKTSIFTDQLNKQVVSPLVTVIDDGTLPGYFGTLGYDDEGTRTNKNILIENGIIKKFMNDRLSAKILNVPATGNGRRESYRNKPVPRMTNTYIAAGNSKPEDIIASVQDGILVKKMGGGQVDITNGDFVFEVTEGYLIKNGKVTDPIRGATLVGNGPQTLSLVDQVGNDLSFIPGICGKYDSAPVTDGLPTLRIKELVVGGIA
jgi:TldD protein